MLLLVLLLLLLLLSFMLTLSFEVSRVNIGPWMEFCADFPILHRFRWGTKTTL
jgi:hypothetical protein